MRLFANRVEAAQELATSLSFLKPEHPIVLGLATGGVPLAEVIARDLEATLDVLLIEPLAAPTAPDHIVAAVDEHGHISMIHNTARWHHLSSQQMIDPAREKFRVLRERAARVRMVLPQVDVKGRTVIIVSQGLATGAKMLAAVTSVKNRGARKIIATAPAGTNKATWALHEAADMVVIPHRPIEYRGVEKFYQHYSHVTDDMMISVLEKWVSDHAVANPEMKILALQVRGTLGQVLSCDLDLPPGMRKGAGPYPAVIFAHGFESSSRSPRNMAISRRCAHQNIVGVRMDFTGHGKSGGTAQHATEEQMLHDLDVVARTIANMNEIDPRRIAVVGSGTGATVALRYAGMQQDLKCVVVRGPIGAANVEAWRKIKAPTLVIHGEKDVDLNATVQGIDHELTGSHRLLRIAESNRLFNDPISLELMVSGTVEWLVDHLIPTGMTPKSEKTEVIDEMKDVESRAQGETIVRAEATGAH